jgi:hypothetical protein
MLLRIIAEAVDQRNFVSLKISHVVRWCARCRVRCPRDGVSVGRISGGHDQMPWFQFH